MSASEGKADMHEAPAECRQMTRSGPFLHLGPAQALLLVGLEAPLRGRLSLPAQGGPGAVRRSTRERSFEVSNDDFAHFQHCLHGAIGLVAVGVP
jgi:hypothetical protein